MENNKRTILTNFSFLKGIADACNILPCSPAVLAPTVMARYVCGMELQIPVGTLLQKSPGDMNVLESDVLDQVCEYIPKHQSAFDAALPAIRAAYDGIMDATLPGIAEVDTEEGVTWDDLISYHLRAKRIVDLLLKHGISEANVMQQKWIAAIGPMPIHPDPLTPEVTAAMLQTTCMYVAFHKLIDVIRKVDLPSDARMACDADMLKILDVSWHGVYDWRASEPRPPSYSPSGTVI